MFDGILRRRWSSDRSWALPSKAKLRNCLWRGAMGVSKYAPFRTMVVNQSSLTPCKTSVVRNMQNLSTLRYLFKGLKSSMGKNFRVMQEWCGCEAHAQKPSDEFYSNWRDLCYILGSIKILVAGWHGMNLRSGRETSTKITISERRRGKGTMEEAMRLMLCEMLTCVVKKHFE